MKLISSAFSFRISPVMAIEMLNPQIDWRADQDLEIGQTYEISSTIYDRKDFGVYLSNSLFSGIDIREVADGYIRVNDTRKWCEIAISLPSEGINQLHNSMIFFGEECEIQVLMMPQVPGEIAGDSRIFLVSVTPQVTVVRRRKP